MVGSPGLPVDDVRLIRPALVHAVAVARAGLVAEPPVQPPDGLRRVLTFRRLQTAALETVRRVLDSDEEFRQRVIEEATEEELGRPAWVWLTRPDGWSDELAGLAQAARKTDDDNLGDRDVARLRRALAGAEEAARRHEAGAERAQEAARRAQAELAEARAQRRDAERAASTARAEAERLAEERNQAIAHQRATASELEETRRDLQNARSALHEAESELALERARETQDAEAGAERRPVADALQGGPAPSIGARMLGARLQAAASTAAALSKTLADAASELAPDGLPDQRGTSIAPGTRPLRPERASRRARGRRPATMPPGVWDDAPEAAAHLVRLPGVVVLVDGYNLARTAWPSLTPEEERLRLISVLEELHARTGAEVTVVFDGIQEGAAMSGQASRTVRVRFTAAGVSADDVVRDMVDRFPLQRPVVVVSSDREVADGARARGANSVSSRQFLTALGR